MRWHRFHALLRTTFVAVGVLLCLQGISAEPTADGRETARQLMKEGRRLEKAGDVPGALTAYDGAHKIMGVPTTGISVARMLAASGKLLEARDTALSVHRMPVREAEDPVFAEAREQASDLAADLEQRIPRLRIVLNPAGRSGETRVSIDDRELPTASTALPWAVNPGRHTVKARAPGFEDLAVEVEVAERELRELALTLRSVAPPPALKPSAAPPRLAPLASAPSHTQPPPPRRGSWMTWTGFGLGSAALLTGALTGWSSIVRTSSIKEHCIDHRCPARYQSDAELANTLATVSDIAFVVSAAGFGLGLYGVLSSPGKGKAVGASPRFDARPVVGAGTVGVHGAF